MALHPECKAFLDTLAAASDTPIDRLPVADARMASQGLIEFGGPEQPVARVENRTVPGPAQPIPVRVYYPRLGDGLPVLMFFHGGGFVLCNLDTHDRQCRMLANAAGCAVVSVDYRMAPEYPFPAAPDDAYAATRYVAEHAGEFGIDPTRLAVAGDSAGGNLATVVAMMSRERGAPAIRFQVLVYPLVDWEDRSASMQEYGQGHFVTEEMMEWFKRQYLGRPDDARHPYASPLHASDFSGLPPAIVITAECDPIRDQGEAYARKLQAAGVPVEARRYEGMIHPFFSLGGIVGVGATVVEDIAGALRQALETGTAAGATT